MILNEFFNLPQVFEKDMTEAESTHTDMTVAQQVFKDNPDIDHEDDILNAAFPYVVELVGSRKRANYMFNYDEDFPGDLISAYRYLQRDQHDVGLEEGASNIGAQIRAVYKKIYDAGDDAVEFVYYDSPIFAQYWDEYEGDLDSIIAEVEPSELQIILDELQSAAEDQGVAEGLSKQFEIIYLDQSGERKRKIVSGTSKESVARQFKKQYKLEIEQVKQLQQGVAEAARWRDPKYKGQLYTQEPPDYNDTREYDRAMWDPKPQGYPGRKELPGGGEYDRTDPLVKGFGRSGVGEPVSKGPRKGLPSRDQITSLKQSIKDISGRHTRANLPEQGRAEGTVEKTATGLKHHRDFPDYPGKKGQQFQTDYNRLNKGQTGRLDKALDVHWEPTNKRKEITANMAESHADQQRKVFKKNGHPVGEVGIDRESSPGVGQWYMKYYATGDDFSGYDSMEEAVAELKHLVSQFKSEGRGDYVPPREADYGPEYQAMVRRVGQKARQQEKAKQQQPKAPVRENRLALLKQIIQS